jgi:hypothetical protein
VTSEICAEIVEGLRLAHPQLVADLQLFIAEFQKVVSLKVENN